MDGSEQYDVCVIGAGTFGSCTAYHISAVPHLKVCLIGPGEPKKKTIEVEAFGCHYDEGRITRIISPFEHEQLLAYRSTQQYKQLKKESGIKVFKEVGVAVVSAVEDPLFKKYLSTADIFCEKNGLEVENVDCEFIGKKWPFFVPTGREIDGRFAKDWNGHISIRNLVRSTQLVAERNGVIRKYSVVSSVSKSDVGYKVELSNGEVLSTMKVVLACGSFSNFHDLLPNGKKLDMDLVGHTVMKFELGDWDRKMMRGFPSLMYKPSHEASYVYLLPPIEYPDGKTYIKLGHTVLPENDYEGLARKLGGLDDVKEWYCKQDFPEATSFFESRFVQMFPDLKPVSSCLDHCVMAITPSGKQYLGFVDDGFFVACGGNGKSAKFGLEIGKICAESIIKGEWASDLDAGLFKPKFIDIKFY